MKTPKLHILTIFFGTGFVLSVISLILAIYKLNTCYVVSILSIAITLIGVYINWEEDKAFKKKVKDVIKRMNEDSDITSKIISYMKCEMEKSYLYYEYEQAIKEERYEDCIKIKEKLSEYENNNKQ